MVSLPPPAIPTDVVEFKKDKCGIVSHPNLCAAPEFSAMIVDE